LTIAKKGGRKPPFFTRASGFELAGVLALCGQVWYSLRRKFRGNHWVASATKRFQFAGLAQR
jgi:hypothetical protein